MPVNNFDVMKRMGERNLKIQLAPLGNIVNVRYVAKQGTKVTIWVAGNVCFGITSGEFVGGLILADRQEFEMIKREMEAEHLDASRT